MTSAVTQPMPASTAPAVATAVRVRWSAAASAARSRHAAMGNAARTGRYARQRRLEKRVSQQIVAVATIWIASLAKSATAVSAAQAAGSAPTERGVMSAATPVRAASSRTTSAARSTPPARRTKGAGSGGSQPCRHGIQLSVHAGRRDRGQHLIRRKRPSLAASGGEAYLA